MELRHLRCFLAVAEELYFACAAERQHIEQSLLGSAAVLFIRNSRSARLSSAGQVINLLYRALA